MKCINYTRLQAVDRGDLYIWNTVVTLYYRSILIRIGIGQPISITANVYAYAPSDNKIAIIIRARFESRPIARVNKITF